MTMQETALVVRSFGGQDLLSYLRNAPQVDYKKGSLIFGPSKDVDTKIRLVTTGAVAIILTRDDGVDVYTALRCKGDLIGDESLVGKPYTTSVHPPKFITCGEFGRITPPPAGQGGVFCKVYTQREPCKPKIPFVYRSYPHKIEINLTIICNKIVAYFLWLVYNGLKQ